MSSTHDLFLTVDHTQPRSKGGTNRWTNRRVAHRLCNLNKADAGHTVDQIYSLQGRVRNRLNKIGKPITAKTMRLARERVGVPSPYIWGTYRKQDAMQRWEDDGGALFERYPRS